MRAVAGPGPKEQGRALGSRMGQIVRWEVGGEWSE